MRDLTAPRLPKWPFFLGDALLLAAAGLVFRQSKLPLGPWEILACVSCVVLGAACGILPFLLDYRTLGKLSEAAGLTTVVAQIQTLEQLAARISAATAQWQTAQEFSDKTAALAKEIADGMAAEVKAFNEFLKRANEGEKSALRLEVDKLRRSENDWLQVLVRTLDHVYALHQAAVRSRQPGLIEQLGHFQNACHDAARRVGLIPFVAAPAEPFDAQRHRVADGASQPPADAAVEETLATGYTFQGKLLRPALVRLRNETQAESASVAPAEAQAVPAPGQSRLPPGQPDKVI